MKRIVFEQGAFEDFTDWATRDRKIHKRIVSLITDVLRQPYQGLGKPEPLKHELQGYWSRRITDEHRLVYTIEGDTVIIIRLVPSDFYTHIPVQNACSFLLKGGKNDF